MRDEIRHMQDAHPEVIDKRLRDAGFVKINGEWIDAHPEVIDKRLRDAGFVKINGEWIDALADPND